MDHRPQAAVSHLPGARTADSGRAPIPDSEEWRERLRTAVRALDAIERPFTDFDRARWDYTSRERYITAIEKRYPEVMAPGG